MTLHLYRGYDTLPDIPENPGRDPAIHDDWFARYDARVRELEAQHDYFDAGWDGWHDVFTLGLAYGWVPAGTELDHATQNGHHWDGGYFSNDGARVTADDATGLAKALEHALRDIELCLQDCLCYASPDSPIARADLASALGLLRDPDGRTYIRTCVRFLERGEFTIE